MNDNICGNCDYCDKTRSNEKGQLRCAHQHCYVDIEGSCPEYFNHEKEDFYNRLLGVLNNGRN